MRRHIQVAMLGLIVLVVGVVVACGGESVPTPTPPSTPEEVYLKSVQRWVYGLGITLGERELYEQDPISIIEAASLDPLISDRPSWMSNFEGMIRVLEPIYVDPQDSPFEGLPVPSFKSRVEGIKNLSRAMTREYWNWKEDPYGNTDAFQRLTEAHAAAFRAAEQLNLDAIKAMNTGEY